MACVVGRRPRPGEHTIRRGTYATGSCGYSIMLVSLQEEVDPRRKVSFEHAFSSKASSVLQQAKDALLRLKYKGSLEVCYARLEGSVSAHHHPRTI